MVVLSLTSQCFFPLIYSYVKTILSVVSTLVKFWVGIHELSESRSPCFEFSSSLLQMSLHTRIRLTFWHPCHSIKIMWWFIWEVTIVVFVHTLMHSVTREKLQICTPNDSSRALNWATTDKDNNTLTQSVYLICSLEESPSKSNLICSDWFSLACCIVIISLITLTRINVLSFKK